jgi:lysophospholipid acyltransferase (LPLAT)-like uncharacterized protein
MKTAQVLYKGSLLHAALSRLAWLYVHFVGLTSRITEEGTAKGQVIYALWHQQQVMAIYLRRHSRICGLVSKSRDGEYIARVIGMFGCAFVRGSTSSGGFMPLRGLIRAARAGYSLAITPDGPRGPVFKAQPGAIYVAMKTGLPIIPVACALSSKKSVNSWDKFQFPLPFGRVLAVYGQPITVSEADDLNAKTAELENALISLTARAEALLTSS